MGGFAPAPNGPLVTPTGVCLTYRWLDNCRRPGDGARQGKEGGERAGLARLGAVLSGHIGTFCDRVSQEFACDFATARDKNPSCCTSVAPFRV